jgi:hypothetical protein
VGLLASVSLGLVEVRVVLEGLLECCTMMLAFHRGSVLQSVVAFHPLRSSCFSLMYVLVRLGTLVYLNGQEHIYTLLHRNVHERIAICGMISESIWKLIRSGSELPVCLWKMD